MTNPPGETLYKSLLKIYMFLSSLDAKEIYTWFQKSVLVISLKMMTSGQVFIQTSVILYVLF